MPRAPRIPISFVVEGDIDDAVIRRIAARFDVAVHEVFVRSGKPGVLKGLQGFNASARSRPWFVQLDLDQDAPCAGGYVQRVLPHPSPLMRFRVAVRAVEAWLLADRQGFSRFFRIRASDIPATPESESDPKRIVTDLGARSGRTIVRNGIPPRPGSGRRTGALYASLLIEFARDHWDVEAARRSSASLDRAVIRLDELAASC